MPFPQFLTQVPILSGNTPVATRQALAPGGSPGPVMVNTTTNNQAMVPGGSYMNGA